MLSASRTDKGCSIGTEQSCGKGRGPQQPRCTCRVAVKYERSRLPKRLVKTDRVPCRVTDSEKGCHGPNQGQPLHAQQTSSCLSTKEQPCPR